MTNVSLPIPLEALEDCGAILGRRGAGKSGVGRVLFEHELAAGHRCCAIDPKGDWWGIRMDKAGAPSGFDIPIFGGEHGDLALTEDMGEMLGRLVATHDLSCVVDLSAFPSQAAQRRFAHDFAEALFEHNRQPITLFLDEADQLAPQRVPADMARLLHAMETLIRLGRQRGIFMWMLTQRPQILNKNLLSQAESLVAMKVTTPHDRGAIRDWMEAHDPDQAKEIEKQLAKLDVGEAYVWVPAADFLERVQFPLFATYDSGRTPRHGETIAAVTLPKIDLSALEQALASVSPDGTVFPTDTIPAEAWAALQKGGEVGAMLKGRDDRIAELERECARLEQVGTILYRQGVLVGLQRARAALDALKPADNETPGETALKFIDEVALPKSRAKAGAETAAQEDAAAEPVSRPAAGRSAAPPPPERRRVDAEAAGDPEPLNQTAIEVAEILKGLAPAGIAFNDALLLIGRRPGSGDAGKARKLLTAHELMTSGAGKVMATRKLIENAAIAAADRPSAVSLVELWEAKLRGPGGDILRSLFDHGPARKDVVADRLGKSPSSGWWGKGMKDLRRSNIVADQAGELQLHPFFRSKKR